MNRYELRTGKFGQYFFDLKEEKDLLLNDVLNILNSGEQAEKKVREQIQNDCSKPFDDPQKAAEELKISLFKFIPGFIHSTRNFETSDSKEENKNIGYKLVLPEFWVGQTVKIKEKAWKEYCNYIDITKPNPGIQKIWHIWNDGKITLTYNQHPWNASDLEPLSDEDDFDQLI